MREQPAFVEAQPVTRETEVEVVGSVYDSQQEQQQSLKLLIAD